MIEMRLRVRSTCRDEAGAWTLAMNSAALRWRVAPELVAAAVVRLLGPSPHGVAGAQRGRLRGGPPGHLLVAGLDVVLQGWCIHTVGLGTVHRQSVHSGHRLGASNKDFGRIQWNRLEPMGVGALQS
jgi:hypothetical protein